ncbi:hypothetical protein FEM48_Zijuj04G0171800 [Ziziphus jujuba var. spinosa]|uniref:Uncharacterized protein n=1 Tax=Ziziphus jujuba var. spinosa TaxID=714518 RepID=A0A978VL46_ZIZJJ|nr:hypothetical protein FEM48_Zijuj04G0171800 [Ziziphus jujuba var. spinosa]
MGVEKFYNTFNSSPIQKGKKRKEKKMAESVVSFVLENLKQFLEDEVRSLSGVKNQVQSLQKLLDIINRFLQTSGGPDGNGENDLVKEAFVEQIREVAREAEDVIDKYIVHVIKQSKRNMVVKLLHLLDVRDVASTITSIKASINDCYDNREKFAAEGGQQQQHSAAADPPYRSDLEAEKDVGEGFADHLSELVNYLTDENNNKRDVVSITGMGGSGKTKLAINIFYDSAVQQRFEECRAFVSGSRHYKIKNWLVDTLKELKYSGETNITPKQLVRSVREQLQGKKYLVVLDGMWDNSVWDTLKQAFPDDGNGSRILITSREKVVASKDDYTFPPYRLPLLNEAESWQLLSNKVFQQGQCVDDEGEDLTHIGQQLAKNCNGLPLSIVVLGDLLKTRKILAETWSEIGDINDKHEEKCLGILASNKIARTLCIQGNACQYISSYEHLRSPSARSLLLFGQRKSMFMLENWQIIYKSFKHTRVLYFWDVRIRSIPKEIEKLVYLTYIRIGSDAEMLKIKALPASICNLPYLETIDIKGQIEETLPERIWRMKQLRHLRVSKGMRFPSRTSSSKGSESTSASTNNVMNHLRILCGLVVQKNANLLMVQVAEEFPNVEKLHLLYDKNKPLEESEVTQLFKGLENLTCLKGLKIVNFPKSGYVSNLFPSTLQKITIISSYLDSDHFRILGEHRKLRFLKISNTHDDALTRFSKLSCDPGSFPKLEVFQMIALKISKWKMDKNAMPKLRRVVIDQCDRLLCLPVELWSLPNLNSQNVEVSRMSEYFTKFPLQQPHQDQIKQTAAAQLVSANHDVGVGMIPNHDVGVGMIHSSTNQTFEVNPSNQVAGMNTSVSSLQSNNLLH